MSGYRQLHTHMWSDGWFIDLATAHKLLFVYLFSNERASVCGLYELPLRVISFETGIDREEIKKGLEVFDKADKVHYDFEAGVVWVVNMTKYQSTSSPKVQARIQADINNVPACNLKTRFLDTVSIRYADGRDTSILISSISQSNSLSLEEGSGEKPIPETPAQAMDDPDIVVYSEVSGRIPGVSQYKTVIDTVGYLRKAKNLTYEMAITYLAPYWLAWSSRKTRDGKPYDPSNLSWLTEWAMNGSVPAVGNASGKPKSAYAQLLEMQKENVNGS
jgi:hypothetical protein